MKKKSSPSQYPSYSFKDFFAFLKKVVSREKKLYWLIIIYGIGISILSLSVPVAVQYIISSITFTALFKPLLVITSVLFLILVFYCLLKATQIYVIHIFSKHFFARIVGVIFNSFIFSDYESFEKQNRPDVANKFFEIITVQKVFPDILFGAFSIIQQILVGFILISFYHFSFFIFSLLIIFMSYLIIRLKGRNSLNSLYETSNNKYEVADLLENISRIHQEFKSGHSIKYAKNKVNHSVEKFIDNKDRYFSSLFSQSILFLILYIFASCGFLLIGSTLVLNGEITISQLVAMELVVSTALLRLSEFGSCLDSFYELCVSCGKINVFYKIEAEKDHGDIITSEISKSEKVISMEGVKVNYQNKEFNLDLKIKAQTYNLISFDSNNSKNIFSKLLLRFTQADAGIIKYYDNNIENIDPYSLRDQICLIDSDDIYQSNLLEYLTGGENISKAEIHNILKIVELDATFKALNLDYNSKLIPGSCPLSSTQIVKLKIAKALIYQPEILILGPIFDRMEYRKKQDILKSIKENYPKLTLIHLTNTNIREYDFSYDRYFLITESFSKSFDNLKEFLNFEHEFFSKNIK